MDTPTFVISPVTTKAEVDELIAFIHSLIDLFPEDKKVLGYALYALTGKQSLIGVGRFEDDLIGFFVVSIDEAPALRAIYIPPELRNSRLGSSLFVFMASALQIEEIPLILIRANPESSRLFERFGARQMPDTNPVHHEWKHMEFSPKDLKRPQNWFESQAEKRQADVNSVQSDVGQSPSETGVRAGIVRQLQRASLAVRRFFRRAC